MNALNNVQGVRNQKNRSGAGQPQQSLSKEQVSGVYQNQVRREKPYETYRIMANIPTQGSSSKA